MRHIITFDTYIGEDEDVTVGVTYFFPGDFGCTYGPPERCYPPEPAEMNWELIDKDGKPVDRDLDDLDIQKIEEEIFKHMTEPVYYEGD